MDFYHSVVGSTGYQDHLLPQGHLVYAYHITYDKYDHHLVFHAFVAFLFIVIRLRVW